MVENEPNQAHLEKVFHDELLPHADALKNFAFNLTGNDADSDDLVQETLIKAFRFASKYNEGTNAKAWLFRIMKNAFINDYRKKKKRPTQVDYEEVTNVHHEEHDTYSSYMDLREEMFENMMGDEISNAINSLPVDFRVVMLLSDVEDFKYEEIAKIVDIPIGTVRSRLHRARNMLKEKLKTYAAKRGYTDKRSDKNSDKNS